MQNKISEPILSIIMPVFNRENLIIESLSSIRNQTFEDWECLIVDDHSTDRSLEVIKDLIKDDKRFQVFRRPDSKKKGANSCRNYGIVMSSGKYIHFFDSDDLAHPDCFKIALNIIRSGSYDYCRFEREIFYHAPHFSNLNTDITSNKLPNRIYEDMITYKIIFNTCNILWVKSSLGNLRFNEDIVFGDEWEYYGRLLLKPLRGINIDKVLFYGRKHPNSTTFEYLNQNNIRVQSKIDASLSLINAISVKLFTEKIAKYFIALAFQLKSSKILKESLKKSSFSFFREKGYIFLMLFDPIFRPLLNFKGRLLKKLKS